MGASTVEKDTTVTWGNEIFEDFHRSGRKYELGEKNLGEHRIASIQKSAEFYQKRDRTIETEFQYEKGDE